MAVLVTKRQKDLLSAIYDYIQEIGYPPSFEEMRERLGVTSNQSIIDHLTKLEEKKILEKEGTTARSIKLLPLGYEVLGRPSLVPFLGVAVAGAPAEAIEIAGEWETVSGHVAKLKDEVFLLKISGDSMINAGIGDGDVVLVKSQKEFLSGDIVLAQDKGEATVKRFMSDGAPPYVYLKPENPNYENILFAEETELKGKIISVLKNGYWKSVK